jgi:type II secretory ATPase GspE/PulE/Tfp pilus assembly ATPase PilB-like protein
VVFRILGKYARDLSLEKLGLSEENEKLIMATSKKPFGMIINTGPAGSGKTTTLYAILSVLNKPNISIITIEDPVEYKIPGIDQIEVNEQTNLTFAEGLRSIVRQDPNIILVGEIRDRKTAEIAVNAALTGHPLLTTFHSNDAATAIPRLMDMGIEPFLLASVLELVIAQRLVRKLCLDCRYSETVSSADLQSIFPKTYATHFNTKNTTLYKAKGCKACKHTGYKGRTAIFELITMTKELRALILKNPDVAQIWAVARQSGYKSLFEDGIEKVKSGAISLEELIRIASEFD